MATTSYRWSACLGFILGLLLNTIPAVWAGITWHSGETGPAVTAVLSIVHQGLLVMVSIKDNTAACAEFIILN